MTYFFLFEILIRNAINSIMLVNFFKQMCNICIILTFICFRLIDTFFIGRTRIAPDDLENAIIKMVPYPQGSTVQLRGEENLPYEVVQKVMLTLATLGITRIEFSASKEPVPPLERESKNENSDKNNQ